MERLREKNDLLKRFTCFQTSFIPICLENGIDPLIMSLWGWNFSYKSSRKLYHNFFNRYSTNPNLFFLKYMGLEVTDIKNNKEFISTITAEINSGEWLVCGIDAFYCKWDYNYSKIHIDHFFLIKTVDFENQIVKCIDWFVDKDKEFEISFEEIVSKVEVIKKIKYIPSQRENDVLKELIKGYDDVQDIIKSFNSFAQDILSVKSLDDLFDNDDMNSCRLLIELKQNNDCRVCIYEYLKKLKIQSLDIIENFRELCSLWNKLLLFFIKIFIKNTINDKVKKEISNLILKIGDIEKEIYIAFQKYL